MTGDTQIESSYRVTRAIERWKRGLAVAMIVFLGLLPGIVAGSVIGYAGKVFGNDAVGIVLGLAAFGLVAPWGLGQRNIARQIGALSDIPDA